MAEAAALRQRAKALEAEAHRTRKEREARDRAEAAAVAELAALAERTFRQPLDRVLAELRQALPGAETWHGRVQGGRTNL